MRALTTWVGLALLASACQQSPPAVTPSAPGPEPSASAPQPAPAPASAEAPSAPPPAAAPPAPSSSDAQTAPPARLPQGPATAVSSAPVAVQVQMPTAAQIRKARGLRCGRRGNYYGCQDAKRQDVIPYEYGVPIEFKASGLALAEHPEHGWLYIDADNRTVLEAEYLDNGPDEYREGLARVRARDKVGFVDREYRLIIPPQFDAAFGFDGGRARVCVGCHPRVWAKNAPERARRQTGRVFLINRSGSEVRP